MYTIFLQKGELEVFQSIFVADYFPCICIDSLNLQEGMVLRLPEKKALPAEGNSEFVYYEVPPKQTEYSLTRKLGVGYSDLLSLNPQLARGLQAGMVLKIPREKTENLEVKNKLWKSINDAAPADCIFASNTSSLSIDDQAAAVPSRASKFAGLHFFSPVQMMRLVEVVKGTKCDDSVCDDLFEFSNTF